MSDINSEKEVSQFGDVLMRHGEEKEDFAEMEGAAKTAKESSTVPDFNYSDPAHWPDDCSEHLQQLIVQHGPRQIVSYDFPKDLKERRFSPIHYKRRLANGEEMCRQWVIYSVSKDVVFCFCCRLFGKRDGGTPTLREPGSKDWKNIAAILSEHERSALHLINYQTWRELELRSRKVKTAGNINQQKLRQEEVYWQQVLERLVAVVRELGTQNWAFGGTSEKLYSADNGNFLKLVECLALFDPVLDAYLRRVQDEETTARYLGKDIQNELIMLLAGAIKKKILARVNTAKYYSVILDSIWDFTDLKHVTMIVRCVDVSKPSDFEMPEVMIKEHFLGFVPLEETTGRFTAETLLGHLEQMGLPLKNLRGQSYDHWSNVNGKENGVQKRILDRNPRAFFMPCSAHSLNLVVSDAVRCCPEATGFFVLVRRIYNYFSASTERWQILTSHVSAITFEPLRQARWESQVDSLKPLRDHLGSIYDAFMEISDDPSPAYSSENESRAEAEALANAICNFKFVASLVTWYNILSEINIASKLLRNKEADLISATNQLQVAKNNLAGCRGDQGFQQVLIDATEVAKELEIPPNFEAEPVLKRRKKQQFAHETQEEALQDPKQKFKVDCYYALLDLAIQTVEERFQQLQHYISLFGFLYDIYNINKKCTEDVRKACKNLEESLTHNGSKDIDAEDLCCELLALARRLPKSLPPRGVLDFMLQHGMQHVLPNVSIALRILLTLPVSMASGESALPKRRLIETYIHSIPPQERRPGLATVSIEHAEASALDLKELVAEFAKEKALNENVKET